MSGEYQVFGDAKDQADLFVFKTENVDRSVVLDLLKDFNKFSKNSDFLDEFQTCRLYEYRGSTLTASEVRNVVKRVMNKGTNKISFLELW
jgi:hypothetical protein